MMAGVCVGGLFHARHEGSSCSEEQTATAFSSHVWVFVARLDGKIPHVSGGLMRVFVGGGE